MDGAYNPGWIYRSSRTAPPPRCPPAAHWNNPVPFHSSLSLCSLPLSLFPSPALCRRHRTDSLLLSLSPTVFPPSMFSVHCWNLSFPLLIVFHSPSHSPPTPLSTLFTIVVALSLSFSLLPRLTSTFTVCLAFILVALFTRDLFAISFCH